MIEQSDLVALTRTAQLGSFYTDTSWGSGLIASNVSLTLDETYKGQAEGGVQFNGILGGVKDGVGFGVGGAPNMRDVMSRKQAENAALAYLCLRRCRAAITETQFHEGFAAARLPGRMEIVPGSPPVVLDGAHTPLAVRRPSG